MGRTALQIAQVLDLSIRTDLQALRDSYFHWLLISTAAVVLGIVMEGPELVHEAIGILKPRATAALTDEQLESPPVSSQARRSTPRWITFLALVGWILVVLGVAGEGVAEAYVSWADSTLQTFNDIRLGDARKEAALALDQASRNERAAEQLRVDLEESKARTNAAQIRLEREERKTAQAQSEAANAQLSFQKYVDEVAKREYPRELDGKKFVKLLEGKPQARIALLYNPNDSEAWSFARDIYDWLGQGRGDQKGAGWIVSPPKPIPAEAVGGRQFSSDTPIGMQFEGAYTGFGITFRLKDTGLPSAPPRSASDCRSTPLSSICLFAAEEALTEALVTSVLPDERGGASTTEYDNSLPDDMIVIIVGPKPPIWHPMQPK